MKKILIVTCEIRTNKFSCSIITANFIKNLGNKFEVDLLSPPETEFNFDHNLKNIFFTKASKLRFIKDYKFLKKVAFRLGYRLDMLFRRNAMKRAFKKINFDNYDIVFFFGAGGNFSPHIAARNLPQTTAILVGYVHDPYPKSAYPKPYNGPEMSYDKNELMLYQKMINRIDYLLFPSQTLGEWMAQHYKLPEKKIVVLPHLLPNEPDFSQKANPSQAIIDFLDKHKLEQNQFFLHTGTLLNHRRIEKLVEAFKELKANGELANQKLVFIGNANYDISTLRSEEVIIIDQRMPYSFIQEFSLHAKALMIIEHVGDISPFLPGKFPEYMVFNKPVLHFGPKNSEVHRLLETYEDVSLSASLDNLEEIKTALLTASTMEGFQMSKELRYYLSDQHLVNKVEELAQQQAKTITALTK